MHVCMYTAQITFFIEKQMSYITTNKRCPVDPSSANCLVLVLLLMKKSNQVYDESMIIVIMIITVTFYSHFQNIRRKQMLKFFLFQNSLSSW